MCFYLLTIKKHQGIIIVIKFCNILIQYICRSINITTDEVTNGLQQLKVNFEVRHLKVGDYAWICRERTSRKELILPYILERKRVDDFGKSIKDGRFHEQKFRLKQSGIQNLIYLIENYDTTHIGLPITTLYQAATNTLIQDGFSVKFTNSLRGTLEYLACLSTLLSNTFLVKIELINYIYF